MRGATGEAGCRRGQPGCALCVAARPMDPQRPGPSGPHASLGPCAPGGDTAIAPNPSCPFPPQGPRARAASRVSPPCAPRSTRGDGRQADKTPKSCAPRASCGPPPRRPSQPAAPRTTRLQELPGPRAPPVLRGRVEHPVRSLASPSRRSQCKSLVPVLGVDRHLQSGVQRRFLVLPPPSPARSALLPDPAGPAGAQGECGGMRSTTNRAEHRPKKDSRGAPAFHARDARRQGGTCTMLVDKQGDGPVLQ